MGIFILQSNSKVEKLTKRQATSNDLTVDATVPKRHRGAAPKKLAAASTSNEVNYFEIIFILDHLKYNII